MILCELSVLCGDRRDLPLIRMQRELLHSPVAGFADVQVVLAAAINGIGRAELFQLLSRFAEPADQPAGEIHLVDFAVDVKIGRGIGIAAVEVLARPGRDADRRRSADVHELRLEVAVAVEHLNPSVAAVGDVDGALRIDRNPAWRVELTGRRPSGTPRLDELAVLVELGHARIAEAIRDINVAGGIPRDVGGPSKYVALGARAGRSTTAPPRRRTLSLGRTASAATGSRARRSAAALCCAGATTLACCGTSGGGRPRRCGDIQHRHALGLRFSPQQQLHLPTPVELDDHARHLIDHPDVVLRIDSYLLSEEKAVRPLSDLAN